MINTIALMTVYHMNQHMEDTFPQDYQQVWPGQTITWQAIPITVDTVAEAVAWVQTELLPARSPFSNDRTAYFAYLSRNRLLILMLSKPRS